MDVPKGSEGQGSELRLFLQRLRRVWGLVSPGHKWALAGATVVMALVSASTTAVALLLGQLVDAVNGGVERHPVGVARRGQAVRHQDRCAVEVHHSQRLLHTPLADVVQ